MKPRSLRLLVFPLLLHGACSPTPTAPSAPRTPTPLHNWLAADFGGVLSVGLEGHRSFESGRRHFQNLCATCHTFVSRGEGPAKDLTTLALNCTPEELLEKILAPANHPRSPHGLMDVLPQEGVLDLLAFLLSGADSKSPFFFAP